MKIFYTDHFVLPLPEVYRFPMQKYSLLRQPLMQAGLSGGEALREPHAATDEEILRAHDAGYLRRVVSGELRRAEARQIGSPWALQMVERSRRSVGATIEACRAALDEGIGVNFAGGTHHAFREHGDGYCAFNDSAIGALAMQAEGRTRRILILDCDAHQGNGSASILANDPSVFTFSIHGGRNFPCRKDASDLDVELADGTGDAEYLNALDRGICHALSAAQPELAIYLAGADPYRDDRLGRLALSTEGLRPRDRMILGLCRTACLPVAIVMAGGYARNISDTVDIHFSTIEVATHFQRAAQKSHAPSSTATR